MEHIASRLLDVLVAHSHENIAVADGQGTLLAVSPGVPLIYGGRVEDYIGRTVQALEGAGRFQPSVTRLVLEQQHEVEVLQHTAAGRTVLARAFPVRNDAGLIEGVISLSFDLTDLNQLRDEYEQRLRAGAGEQAKAARQAGGLTLESPASRAAFTLVERVAATDASVLFLGESGVGKTQFARHLHASSRRRAHRLVEVNCAALPENLIEAELFGYESGAFTGATAQGKPGLIETADRGTLFLDEIGEAPPSVQAKLLKVLNDRRITRVGGRTEREVDFRLIAATNRNLAEQVARGEFRADLFYRINVFPITIAPLRQRPEDLAALIDHALASMARRYGQRKTLRSSLRQRLQGLPWPGNVRELENHIERLYLANPGSVIDFDPLEDAAVVEPIAHGQPPQQQQQPQAQLPSAVRGVEPLAAAVARVERELLGAARLSCKSTYEIARLLGVSQPTVVRKLREYGL